MTDRHSDPEQLAQEALALYQSGEYSIAVGLYCEARDSFKAVDQQVRAAEMSNNLCVCLLQLDQPQEAYAEVSETPAVFDAAGNMLLKAQALGNRAMANAARGHVSEAESDYRNAADIFRELHHEEGLQYTMQALSRLQLKQGRPMEALDAMQSAVNSKSRRSLRDRLLTWLFKLPTRLLGR